MKDPQHNRLHGYEAGWLALLLQLGVASLATQGRPPQQEAERPGSTRAFE